MDLHQLLKLCWLLSAGAAELELSLLVACFAGWPEQKQGFAETVSGQTLGRTNSSCLCTSPSNTHALTTSDVATVHQPGTPCMCLADCVHTQNN